MSPESRTRFRDEDMRMSGTLKREERDARIGGIGLAAGLLHRQVVPAATLTQPASIATQVWKYGGEVLTIH